MQPRPLFSYPGAILALILMLWVPACTSTSGPVAEEKPRVIVLGIDGGTWTVMKTMIKSGELPNIAKLYNRGMRGVLVSRPPVLSPVVWTTIFTGRGHAEHGITNWANSQSQHRKVRALWDIVGDYDRRAVVLNVPGTWPPEPVNGVMLSGFPLSGSTIAGNTGKVATRKQIETGGISPVYRKDKAAIWAAADALEVGQWSDWISAGLNDRPNVTGAVRVMRLDQDKYYITPYYRTDEELVVSYPKDLRLRIGDQLSGPYIPEGPGWSRWEEPETPEYLYDHLEQIFDVHTEAALQYAGGDWDLFLYVMTFTDRVSHPYWAYDDPDYFPNLDAEKAALYAGSVAKSYRETDEHLGRILAEVKGDPYIILCSDHGFHNNRNNEKAIGTHDYDGIYLIAGHDIQPTKGPRVYIEDIMPTVLYLMDIPSADDISGKALVALPEMLKRPVEFIVSHEGGSRDGSDEPVDEDTWEQLRGLGYVDGEAPSKAGKGK